MAGRVAGRPGARAAERDGIKHTPGSEAEHLEAARVGGGGKHERVGAIDGKRAHPIDGWPGVERHLIGGRIHHVGVVVVAAGVASQVRLRAVQRNDRVVAVGACLDRANGLARTSIKDGVGAIGGVCAVRHVDGGAIRRHGELVHAERVVGDPGHHIMHEVICQQAAVTAAASARATLADVEQAPSGCHCHSALARLGNGELFDQRMVVVNVIGVDRAIVHHVEPVG